MGSMQSFDVSSASMIGGVIGGSVFARGSSTMTVSGGAMNGMLLALDAGQVLIEADTLNYPPGPIADIQGTLIGTLADGSPINIPFGRASTATITVPELARKAGTLVALAALAAVETRRRRLERSSH
jgi:hypothetical protein